MEKVISNLHISIIRILKGKQYISKGVLELHIEVIEGELPKKGNYIFLKEQMYSIYSYPIISVKKKLFNDYFIVRILFEEMEWKWKERIEKYIIESDDKNVFCGISPEEYIYLDAITKKSYIKSIVNLLGTNRIKNYIYRNLKFANRLIRKEIDKNTKGLTKIGGLPDLPNNLDFPKDSNGISTLFLSQISISEINKWFSSSKELNGNGILYFFATIDTEDEEYPTFGEIIVKYSKSIANLNEKEVPEDINSFGFFKKYDLFLSEEVNIPDQRSALWVDKKMNNEERDSYWYIESIIRELNYFYTDKFLGHPEPIQECVLIEAELISNKLLWFGETPHNEDNIENVYKKIIPNCKKWRLLYQFNADDYSELSQYKEELNQYNSGTYYVLIKQNDLDQINFENTITVYQST